MNDSTSNRTVAFLASVFFAAVLPWGTVGCCDSSAGSVKTESFVGEPIRTLDDWERSGRTKPVRRIVCDGSGSLRLATYLQVSDRVVAVEQVEKNKNPIAPYRIVRAEYGDLPVFGEGHGRDNVEFLLSLNPPPDVIIRVDSAGAGIDPKTLQERTGIPVVVAPYGDLGANKKTFEESLRLLGAVLDKRERAEEIVAFIDAQIADLERRTRDVSDEERPSVYLGGLSRQGSRGINSTAPIYPPFDWLRLRNAASELKSAAIQTAQATVSPEQIVAWNPDFIFLDLGTLGLTDGDGWTELTSSPIYRSIHAVQNDRVYAVYPNNSYNGNYEATLVNAWFIGKTVWRDRFGDVELERKSDEICRFLLGDRLSDKIPETLKRRLYRPVAVRGDGE